MPAVSGEHSRHDFKLNDGGLALLMPVPPDQTAHLVNVQGGHGYAVDGYEDVADVDGSAAVSQAGGHAGLVTNSILFCSRIGVKKCVLSTSAQLRFASAVS